MASLSLKGESMDLRFDFSSAQWSGVSPVCVNHEPEEGGYWRFKEGVSSGVCCAYTFVGFWKYGYAVHELNLEMMGWQRLEPQNREEGLIVMQGW